MATASGIGGSNRSSPGPAKIPEIGRNPLNRINEKFVNVGGDGQSAAVELSCGLPASREYRTHMQYQLWIDGVGMYLLCLDERISIGSVTEDPSMMPTIALMANMSRHHADIVRSGEGYVIEPFAATKVCGREVHATAGLSNGYEIELARGIRLEFRIPSALSASARLEVVSDHRPGVMMEAAIAMEETCLAGPSGECHIRCSEWTETVLFYRKQGSLWCKSSSELFLNGKRIADGAALSHGDVITGPDLRFRLEEVTRN